MSSNVLTVFDYPVFLNLADVDVLVVGGGRIGLRKVAGLAGAGARVRLVAPEVDAVEDELSRLDAQRKQAWAGRSLVCLLYTSPSPRD